MKNPVIELRNVHFTYPDGTSALNGINLSVAANTTLGLIGPNGAGKSTLLLHLNGILKQYGSVKICGIESEEGNIALIRKNVGLVFQDPDSQLFMPTVFDDVAFGPLNLGLTPQMVKERVAMALDMVDMPAALKRSPHHLSFGEKKGFP